MPGLSAFNYGHLSTSPDHKNDPIQEYEEKYDWERHEPASLLRNDRFYWSDAAFDRPEDAGDIDCESEDVMHEWNVVE